MSPRHSLLRPVELVRELGWGALLDRARHELERVRRESLLRTIEGLTRLLPRRDADTFHDQFPKFIDHLNQLDNPRILEIGSRNVSGNVRKSLFREPCEYVGFDIHPGPNVDVVGDAHRLSQVVSHGHFDGAFSISVFEHLAMPWKVVLELNRVLKPGGLLFLATHPTWPPHELPWDFWRFGAESFRVMLNQRTGFELIGAFEGLPCSIIPHGSADPALTRHTANLGVAVIARKIGEPDPELRWDLPVVALMQTMYPAPRP